MVLRGKPIENGQRKVEDRDGKETLLLSTWHQYFLRKFLVSPRLRLTRLALPLLKEASVVGVPRSSLRDSKRPMEGQSD